MNTLGIRGKLFFTFSVTLILFLIFAALTSYELLNIRSRQITARTDAATSSKLLLELRVNEQQLQINSLSGSLPKGFYQTGQTAETQAINTIFSNVNTPLNALITYYRTYQPPTVKTLQNVKSLLANHQKAVLGEIHTLQTSKTNQITLLPISNALSAELDGAQQTLATTESDITTRTTQVIDLTIALLIVISLCFIGIGTLLTYVMGQAINSPLKRLLDVTKDVAGGDLQKRVDIRVKDEFGELATSFNTMADSLTYSLQELRNEKAKLQASISSLTVGFILVGTSKRITTINHAALRMLWPKLAQSDTASFTLESLVEKMAGIIDLPMIMDKSVTTRELAVVDELAIGDRFFKFVITPIIQDTQAIGSVILVDDITEAKIVERSKDEFFSIASHELRTPLTAIKGNTSMIEEYFMKEVNNPLFTQMVSDIHESSDRLIGIVNDFLDMSRLQQGKMVFQLAPLDLTTIIEATIREYQMANVNNQTKLVFQKDSILQSAYADPNKVKQILINLIGNAYKFTTEGTVTIRALFIKPTANESAHIKIVVSDTGEGIPEENKKLLFRKFQQAGSSLLTRDTTKGTGLGLYISKLIVEGMGGTIALESSVVGKGSTFSFTLPIATKDQLHVTKPVVITHTNSTTGITEQGEG